MKALLDTHILIWWIEGGSRLSPAQRDVLEAAAPDQPLLLSEISLWEVSNLVSLGRLQLTLPLRDWLEQATAPPLVKRLGISPVVAAEVAALPDHFHRDSADRVIVATAKAHGATLVTQDRKIIDAEIVPTL